MSTLHHRTPWRRHALASAVFFALAGAASAQLSTATIKGQVQAAGSAQRAGLTVLAVNTANGATYRAQTQADGSYTLLGLAPGSYEIRVGDARTERITLAVGETAAVDLRVGAADQLGRVTVVGSAQRQGVRDSQMGTNVSSKMLEGLPQTSRNFLSAIDLAPGVAFQTDGAGYTSIQAGSQSFDHVNVFIDGVGQKNNIQPGGVSGQATSRGNPFPQSAIAEYKVITQNYKAEFDQVSSAAITAITKSGTNELHGEVYGDRTGTNWRAMNMAERQREAAGVPRPPSSKNEYGFSIGGPIKRDQAHFFFAYDGKNIDDSRQIVLRNRDKLPNAGIVPSLVAAQGNQVDTFKEHLLFGKVDVNLDDEQRLSVSFRVRREEDRVPENRDLSLPGNDKARKNDETRFDIKHEWARGPWLNEARAGYEDYTWAPQSAATTPFIKYKVANDPAAQLLTSAGDVIFGGGSPDAQHRAQKGFSLANDLTYTGIAGHTLKMGAKFKAMKYRLSGTYRDVDVIETLIDRVTGNPYFNGTACTGTNVTNGGLNSDQCKIDRAVPRGAVNYSNNQFGIYIQDDWAVTKQLELNLGIRWDYESNMLNNDYVTPADRAAALRGLDVPRWGITPPAGQTYAQSLAKGGVNIEDFISSGNRKPYKGAFAPRVGASYDLLGDRMSVLFGGWGRSYDRTMANYAIDVLQSNATPGSGEIRLISNKVKVPFADQFSVGLRQALGEWNAEIALSQIHAKNQFIQYSGNRDANGGTANQSPIDPLWNGPTTYGNLILGDSVGETKTRSVLISAAKPYSAASGWAANIAYTYSDAKTTHKEWKNDPYDWTYGRGTHGWNRSTDAPKHRLVVAGVADRLLPWDLQLSGKGTWSSGSPRRVTSCAAGWDKCINVEGSGAVFRQVDLGLAKAMQWGIHRVSLRMDVINLFNNTSYDGLDDWGGGPVPQGGQANKYGGDNLNVGTPNSVKDNARAVKLTASYAF